MSKTYSEIVAAGVRAAVLFTSITCGPCKRLKPRMEALAAQEGLQLHILDISGEMDAVRALGIRGVPTMVAVGGLAGKPEVLFTGDQADDAIAAKLRAAGVMG